MDEWRVWDLVGFYKCECWKFCIIDFFLSCTVVIICIKGKIEQNKYFTSRNIKDQPTNGHNRSIRRHNERLLSHHPRNPTLPSSIKIHIKNKPHSSHNIYPYFPYHGRLRIIICPLLLHKNEYKVTKENIYLYWWVIVKIMGNKLSV